jgi:hypothetical protein
MTRVIGPRDRNVPSSAAMSTIHCLRVSRRDEENGPTLDREWALLERMVLGILNRIEQLTKVGTEMANDLRAMHYDQLVGCWDALVPQVAKKED